MEDFIEGVGELIRDSQWCLDLSCAGAEPVHYAVRNNGGHGIPVGGGCRWQVQNVELRTNVCGTIGNPGGLFRY
jgi:hypothetical protein